MSDFLKAAVYGLPAIAFALGLAIWAERRFGRGRRK
jgi:hypothetical protein